VCRDNDLDSDGEANVGEMRNGLMDLNTAVVVQADYRDRRELAELTMRESRYHGSRAVQTKGVEPIVQK
jgi:hypothetical protein